jgi:hypothetical protein
VQAEGQEERLRLQQRGGRDLRVGPHRQLPHPVLNSLRQVSKPHLHPLQREAFLLDQRGAAARG